MKMHCPQCDGEGEVPESKTCRYYCEEWNTCQLCRGSGELEVTVIEWVKIQWRSWTDL